MQVAYVLLGVSCVLGTALLSSLRSPALPLMRVALLSPYGGEQTETLRD